MRICLCVCGHARVLACVLDIFIIEKDTLYSPEVQHDSDIFSFYKFLHSLNVLLLLVKLLFFLFFCQPMSSFSEP